MHVQERQCYSRTGQDRTGQGDRETGQCKRRRDRIVQDMTGQNRETGKYNSRTGQDRTRQDKETERQDSELVGQDKGAVTE